MMYLVLIDDSDCDTCSLAKKELQKVLDHYSVIETDKPIVGVGVYNLEKNEKRENHFSSQVPPG